MADDTEEIPGTAPTEEDVESVSRLVQDLKGSRLVKSHRRFLTVYMNTFTGRAFVDWMVEHKHTERERAVEMGQQLIDEHYCRHVHLEETFRDEAGSLYRLMEHCYPDALNAGEVEESDLKSVSQLGESLRKKILRLYGVFLSSDGKKLDYQGMKDSDQFKAYVKTARALQRVRVQEAGRDQKLAFFINIYNALVIHANVVRGPPTNLWQRYKFFNYVKYIIGGYTYSLQDIENGVLRANRKGVGMFGRPFKMADPRLKVALETHEPLIHFALVCGAKSCPPINCYGAERVMGQLKIAGEVFLSGPDACSVDMSRRTVSLSMIFKWYQEDFGRNNKEVVQFVHDNMADSETKQQLEELLTSRNDFKVTHVKYDWSVNCK